VLIARFLALRLAVAVPVVLGIVFLTFMLIRIGHQDPVALLAGPMADASTYAMIRKELDLDRPLLQQFVTYVRHVAHGDLGRSWQGGAPVLDEIVTHFPITLELVVLAVGIAALIGIPVGIRAAMRPNGRFDQVTRFGALAAFSIPTYWMGLMAILIFFYLLRWAPPPMGRLSLEVVAPPVVTGSALIDSLLAGSWQAARSAAAQLVLPVGCFVLVAMAPIIKQTRAVAIEVVGSDYMRFARASGFSGAILRRMALRNSLAPVLTFLGTEVTSLLAAASLIEYIFSWGGLGQWGLNGILQGDFAVVQGYVLALALSSVIVFLVVDLAVLVLEPRSHRHA
jgi:peptide/nickel transport system permease protein